MGITYGPLQSLLPNGRYGRRVIPHEITGVLNISGFSDLFQRMSNPSTSVSERHALAKEMQIMESNIDKSRILMNMQRELERLRIGVKMEPIPDDILEDQVNTANSTVVRQSGEIIATFSETGYISFFQRGDAFLPDISSTPNILKALEEKYGSSLSIAHYASGEGPTVGDVAEEMEGYAPRKSISELV